MDDRDPLQKDEREPGEGPVVAEEQSNPNISVATDGVFLPHKALLNADKDFDHEAVDYPTIESLMAGLKPLPSTEAIHAALKPLPNMEAIHAAMTRLPNIEAIHAAMNPLRNMESIHAAMNPLRNMEAIHAAMNPLRNMEAIHAAMNPLRDMESIRAAMNPPRNMEAIHATMKPLPSMEAIHAAMKPLPSMEAIHAAMNPLRNMEALHAAMNPLPSMEAIHAAMKPLPSMEAILATMKSFPAMVSLGASLAAFGTPTLHNPDWQTITSPSFLGAVNVAVQVFSEDRTGNSSLTSLIAQLSDGASTGVIELSPEEIEAELSSAAHTGDVTHLSDAAKRYMSWLYWIIGTFFAYLALQNGVREELCFLQPKIMPGMTASQMGKAIRRTACDVPFDLLKGYRFVRGEAVRLRKDPNMKAEILPIILADGALLEVLSTDNRDWLYVSVVGQDRGEGWISRKYAKQLVY